MYTICIAYTFQYTWDLNINYHKFEVSKLRTNWILFMGVFNRYGQFSTFNLASFTVRGILKIKFYFTAKNAENTEKDDHKYGLWVGLYHLAQSDQQQWEWGREGQWLPIPENTCQKIQVWQEWHYFISKLSSEHLRQTTTWT